MTTTNETYVFIHLEGAWIPCGHLTMLQDGRRVVSTFQYGRKYLERDNAVAVDPVQLPLRQGVFTSTAASPLFGGIRDASPDGWGRHLLDRAAEPGACTEFEYLTALPVDDRIGALGFGATLENGPGPIVPDWKWEPVYGATLSLAEMIQAADRVDAVEELAPRHRRFLMRGSSLGGAQPKAPAWFEGSAWIAKFGRQHEAWNTCRIENATMRVANECGLVVPETRTLTVAGRDVFLIRRFDRDGTDRRRHFVSAATLLGTADITTGSYQEIAVGIKRYGVAGRVKDDLEQLYRRMVFNILCNNSDDHLRNHGMLHQPGKGWRLSPAYDVVPQPDMGPGQPRRLTLGVGMDDSRTATLGNALSVCAVFGLAVDDARALIQAMQQTFLSRWETIFTACGVPQKDFPALAEAFVNHLR
jgi:serine/threonine-protein kinase HipA